MYVGDKKPRFAHWAGTVGRGWRAENNKVIQGKDKSQNFLKLKILYKCKPYEQIAIVCVMNK
jgi:hypothetical protein